MSVDIQSLYIYNNHVGKYNSYLFIYEINSTNAPFFTTDDTAKAPAPPPETAIVHLLRPLRGRRQKKSRDGVVFPDDNSYICRAMQQQMRHSASGDYLNIKRRDEFHA